MRSQTYILLDDINKKMEGKKRRPDWQHRIFLWAVLYVVVHNYTYTGVVWQLYRMDLNFRGIKLSRFSRFDSHPRKFSTAKI